MYMHVFPPRRPLRGVVVRFQVDGGPQELIARNNSPDDPMRMTKCFLQGVCPQYETINHIPRRGGIRSEVSSISFHSDPQEQMSVGYALLRLHLLNRLTFDSDLVTPHRVLPLVLARARQEHGDPRIEIY